MKYEKTGLRNLINSSMADNGTGAITAQIVRNVLTGVVDSYSNEGGFIDPHDYGAKGDAVSLLRAVISVDKTQVTDSQYTFKTSDIGKTVWIETGWQNNGETRTIASINAGAAVFNTPSSVSGTRVVLFGTDDTQAIQSALNAAATKMLDVQQLGQGSDPVSWGGIAAGGIVRLRGGTGYIIKNTQAEYDSGKKAALLIPRHCGLIGAGMGQTCIYVAPGNVGYGIANWGTKFPALAGDERITMGNFSIFGMRGLQGSQCLDLIYFSTSQGNYTNVDNYSFFFNMQIYQSRARGFFINGRGECQLLSIWVLNCEQEGFYFDGIQDTRIIGCNAGGNGYAGMYVKKAASCSFDTCKSFYNGANGGTDVKKTCNWYVGDGSQYRIGSVIYSNCESQESRGSGWYIEGGINQFSGCLSSDPKRFGGSPWPAVCAGIHIAAAGSNNVFEGFYVRASLGLDWSNNVIPEQHYGGDYAVYIERNATATNNSNYGPRNNKGTIYTLTPSRYDVAKLGGPGITNRLNGELCIDGNFLPSDWPSAPTITSVVYGPASQATVTLTAPTSDGGRVIRDYVYQYKLAADTEWTEFTDPMSDTAGIDITGLTNSESYKIRAAAVNANGRGAWSDEFSYTHSPTAPYQITSVTKIVGNGKVYLTWSAPVTGGSAITDYVIEYKLTSEPTTWTTFSDGTSTTTSATVTGLVNDSSYDFRVSAVNAIGTGPVSATVTDTPRLLMDKIFDVQLLQHNDFRVASSIVAANGTAIETWQDISGRAMHLTQSTAGEKPSKGTQQINGVDAVSFDGADDRLNFSSAMITDLPSDDFTMFIAFKIDAARLNQTNALLDTNDNSFLVYVRGDVGDITCKCGGGIGASKPWVADTGAHIIMVRRIGANMKIYLDGSNTGATNETAASNPSPTSMWIGRVNKYYGWFDGCYAALTLYNDDLSNSRCNEIGNALQAAIGSPAWTTVTA